MGIKYNKLEEEVNLCELQQSSDSNKFRCLCANFNIRLSVIVAIGSVVLALLVLFITLTVIYYGNGWSTLSSTVTPTVPSTASSTSFPPSTTSSSSFPPLTTSSSSLPSTESSTESFIVTTEVDKGCGSELDFNYLDRSYKASDFEIDENTAAEIFSIMNTSVDPCDNFYDFACQGWKQAHPRPGYLSFWTEFTALDEKMENTVIELMESPPQSQDIRSFKLAQNFYKSCMQVEEEDNQDDEDILNFVWDTLEEYGGWPMLYKSGTWNSTQFNWMKSMTDLNKRFMTPTLLNINSHPDDMGRLSYNLISVHAPHNQRLSKMKNYLPTCNYSVDSEKQVDFIVNASKILLKFKGQNNIDDDDEDLRRQAKAILDVQNELDYSSKLSWDVNTQPSTSVRKILRDPQTNYTMMTLEELQVKIDDHLMDNGYDTVHFREILKLLYEPAGVFVSEQQSMWLKVDYVLDILKRVQAADVKALANFLHYKMLVYMMPMLTRDFRELVQRRSESECNDDSTQLMPRNRTCAQEAEENYKFAVGHKVVKRQYKDLCEFNDVLIPMKQMFYHIKDVLKNHKSSLHSYYPDSKLTELIDYTEICVGFPDWIFDPVKVEQHYYGLQLNGEATYSEQKLVTNEWNMNSRLKMLRKSKSEGRCHYDSFPGEVNAFSEYRKFLLDFPLGILQKPFLRIGQSLALNYGTMGSIIGHELSHAFSDLGWEKYELGYLSSKGTCLVEQYSKFSLADACPKANISVRENFYHYGKNTVDEDFADNGGLALAYEAFKLEESKGFNKDNNGNGTPTSNSSHGLHRYNNDQLFFIGLAQNDCFTSTVKGMKEEMKWEEHSPGIFRVLGTFRNSKEFADVWNCPVGSKMNPHTNEHKKCELLKV